MSIKVKKKANNRTRTDLLNAKISIQCTKSFKQRFVDFCQAAGLNMSEFGRVKLAEGIDKNLIISKLT